MDRKIRTFEQTGRYGAPNMAIRHKFLLFQHLMPLFLGRFLSIIFSVSIQKIQNQKEVFLRACFRLSNDIKRSGEICIIFLKNAPRFRKNCKIDLVKTFFSQNRSKYLILTKNYLIKVVQNHVLHKSAKFEQNRPVNEGFSFSC